MLQPALKAWDWEGPEEPQRYAEAHEGVVAGALNWPIFPTACSCVFLAQIPAGAPIVEEITPLLLEKLRAGTMEVAIVALPLRVRNHQFQSFPLTTEKLYAVLAERHSLGAAGRFPWGITRQPLFAFARWPLLS